EPARCGRGSAGNSSHARTRTGRGPSGAAASVASEGSRMNAYDIIRRPIITEKSTMLAEGGQYVFEVARDANKIEVKKAVEEVFRVHVRAVNIVRVSGKLKRMGRTAGLTAAW